jgi:hypothetical protein
VAGVSSLQTWFSNLQQNFHSLTGSVLELLPVDIHDKINQVLTEYSTASYTTFAALLLSLLFLVARFLMSSYSSYTGYGGGRSGGSPYNSSLGDPYARNLSRHFEYIDADHDILHDNHRHSVSRAHDTQPLEDPDGPDVVIVRYMASMLPVEFPAYSISEETAYVGQLREAVARYLETDPRRVRLVYKKKDLKHDSWPLRKYNMKQNSEVAAIKSEAMLDYSDRDSRSSSGEDIPDQLPKRRARAPSSVRHRSEENLLPNTTRPTTTSAFLSPNGHVPSTTTSERQSRNSLRPEFDDRSNRRDQSRNRGVSPHPAPSATPVPPAAPKVHLSTPSGQVQALADTFHTQWLPSCRKFIASPPAASADREKEHRKLSESIMTHITLKADAIEVDKDARLLRKSLLNEIDEVMKQMDAVKG